MATFIVGTLVLAVVAFAAYKAYKNRKDGGCGCKSCNCNCGVQADSRREKAE